MINKPADYWIQRLKLEKHPEGGHYTRIYASDFQLKQDSLPKNFHGDRSVCTHIYYLLQKDEFSAFHRIQSDELWHFYNGDALKIYEINKDGSLSGHVLGLETEKEQAPFCFIKAGNWFAAELLANSNYTLVGCTVSPGFDFAEFELAKKERLSIEYPKHEILINRLTK